MGFVDIRVKEATAPLRGKAIRVYRPSAFEGFFCASAYGEGDWNVMADAPGFATLAGLTMLAAAKSSSIVYIPKGPYRPHWLQDVFPSEDLVLCHHSLQLPPSAWKGMRQYLSKGQDRSFSVQAPDPDLPGLVQYGDKSADVFDFARHSGTIFLTASEKAFQQLARQFARLQTAVCTGDHGHVWLVRGKGIPSAKDDLTATFVATEDWR